MPEPAADLVSFTMPSLGADMDEGTIVDWRVAPGATVRRGDVVAVVETDKSDLDVEVFVDGVVHELIVPTGVRVPVGTVLATIEPTVRAGRRPTSSPAPSPSPERPVDEPAPALAASAPRGAEPGREPTPPLPAPPPPPPPLGSPVLRHLAEQLHVDVARLHGSGAGGRVTRDDIEAAARARSGTRPTERRHPATPRARRLARVHGLELAEIVGGRTGTLTGDDVLRIAAEGVPAAPPAPATTPTVPVDPMRAAIARQMERAWREIPHFQVAQSIDVGAALAALAAHNDGRSANDRVLAAAVFVRAAARAAAAVPTVNGWWRDGAAVAGDGVHVGLVVALRRGGLVAPVVHDADTKDLETVMAEFRDLVTRARAGRLRASEMSGATFTVTQLGEGEVDTVVPIIHPPQLAILGLGAVQDRPWALGGALAVRPVLRATLAVDHRAVDGRAGSAYLLAFSRLLQEDPK